MRLCIDFEESSADFTPDFGALATITSVDYEVLSNKPRIEDVTLEGNRSFAELGLESLTNAELSELLKL